MSDRRNKPRARARPRPDQTERANSNTQRVTAAEDYTVSSTWTNPIHVTDRELEAIELYLGDAIDRLLGLSRRPRSRGPP
jgi:hypothetical protein